MAVLDVDGTLLRGDCLWLAARRSRGAFGQLGAALECLPWLISWQLKLVSTARFKQEAIAAFQICESFNRTEAHALGASAWLTELRGQLRPEALERLRWHQCRGDRVLLCSASPRMLLQPLADWLGVELLCTELQRSDGDWQPVLASANCKGPEKIRRLREHLGLLEGLAIEAYGDSKGDRELLQAATRPHYRSFADQPVPYPAFSLGPLLPVVALALLGYGLLGAGARVINCCRYSGASGRRLLWGCCSSWRATGSAMDAGGCCSPRSINAPQSQQTAAFGWAPMRSPPPRASQEKRCAHCCSSRSAG